MGEMTTIAACSTALGAIMSIAILLSWFKDGRPVQRSWQFAPFGLSVPAGVLLTWPELLPGEWALRLGWFALTMVYGSAWLAARVTAGRRPAPLAMMLPCLAVLVFSGTLGADANWPELRMLPRTALFAAFNALAARECARMRDPQLPAATTLLGIFAAFAAIDFLRLPFTLSAPAPLGPGETQMWSIALFNFMIVVEGMLLGVFLTALNREQVSARHYRLASIDPLTGIGNRRALDDRIEALSGEGEQSPRMALAVLDIDRFKAINDELGHGFGDVVIVGAANIAREVFGGDNVFRVGGEEFAAIIEAPSSEAAIAQAEAMRTRFAARAHVADGALRRCTVSIGLAMLEPGEDHTAAFRAADHALYVAKRLGRDQTVMADAANTDEPDAPIDFRAAAERLAARR